MEKLWLQHFGFHFDPFKHLEASVDPNLNRYLVRHEIFSVAWGETPAFIFSPPGGGKTALRIYTARASWTGAGGFQPFPIHYHIPRYYDKVVFSTIEEHLKQIVFSGAHALFLAFAYYPLIFLKAPSSLQKKLSQFIFSWTPNVEYYLEILRSGQPDQVAEQLNPSYQLHQPPDEDDRLLSTLCEKLEGYLKDKASPVSPSIQIVFKQFMTWILQDLGFRSVYLLIDGVDGFPELARMPGFATQSLMNLFAQAPVWAKNGIQIKGFLPIEMREHLRNRLKVEWPVYSTVELKWNEAMLAEMLQRRVYAAVDGEFASLGAVSAIPTIQNLESELAHSIYPLPREMLVLVNRVLFEYDKRIGENSNAKKQIQSVDIDKALFWYRTEQAPITQYLASVSGE